MPPQPDRTPAAGLRYGLIGAGMMGAQHIAAVDAVEGVETVAVADSCPGNLAAARDALPGATPYERYQDMLEKEDLDAVVVATPNCTHAEIVCHALRSGRHVLGEKPMAAAVADCSEMISTAEAAGKIYQVGLELRYTAVCRKIRALIDDGSIGRVRQLWCKEFRGPWALKVDQWITQQSRSGGTFVEKNCHHFDLFNWFVGRPPLKVAAFATRDLVYGPERFDGVTPDVLDNGQVIVRYEQGAVAALMLCMYCTDYQEGLELGVVGTEGWIVANIAHDDALRLYRRESRETVTCNFRVPEEIKATGHGGAVHLEHLAFRDNIREQRAPLTGGNAGWWSVAVGVAAELAAAEQRIVAIEELGQPPV